MMTVPRCSALCLVLLVCSAPVQRARAQSAQPASVTLPPELARVLRDYERAWTSRDAAALAALFADGQPMLTNTGMPALTRADVRNRYAGSGGTLALRAFAWATADTVGYVLGAYSMKSGDPDAGTYVLALKRARGGAWLIVADMDKSLRR